MSTLKLTEQFPVDPEHLKALHARLERAAQASQDLDIAYRTVDSAVGPLLVAATDRGLLRVAFTNESHERVLQNLAERISPRILKAPARLDPVARQLDEYFAGRRREFDVPLDWSLSQGFRRNVLGHLANDISYGSTASYAAVARMSGSPRAVRAVGTACATNPIPIVVPCHRVIRSDGQPWAYRGGAAAKQALLDLEANRDSASGPARNRVTPLGDIIAATGRGAWMGSRGCLHGGRGSRNIVRAYQNTSWITCALSFKDRRIAQWEPNRYTVLFFLDEAVALSAGHRPCAECRRGAYNTYRTLWAQTHGGAMPYAKDMDAQLHRERTDPVNRSAAWDSLPDGTFVATDGGPAVVVGQHLTLWSADDNTYQNRMPRPTGGDATLLTPPSTVGILRAGYPVQIDASAR